MIKYSVNRGINKPMEFKGLKAQYIGYLAAGLGLTLIAFAIGYVIGMSMYLCLTVAVVLATADFVLVFHLSATYGEHGLMKKMAQNQVPDSVIIRSRKIFCNLIKS
ncbi:DUF4133 domain-containing protein [Algoriphagus sp. C2-6-M1]|uniref:DUF4133 domain-containing protein n=1 Tax=Algoriphagus persicinus TaxID=3108754 RepID=UPI002B387619|nr:DUF4133 domain-containing protein [Algoriphagus sp. C2-6-M1]MEB2782184.1 DUF4133 domain-containing protein [Algoriphagus sp. C2-6-M1]